MKMLTQSVEALINRGFGIEHPRKEICQPDSFDPRAINSIGRRSQLLNARQHSTLQTAERREVGLHLVYRRPAAAALSGGLPEHDLFIGRCTEARGERREYG